MFFSVFSWVGIFPICVGQYFFHLAFMDAMGCFPKLQIFMSDFNYFFVGFMLFCVILCHHVFGFFLFKVSLLGFESV